MRFVFISTMTGYAWGGSEELWSQTAVCLRDAAHTVSALVEDNGPRPPKLDAVVRKGIDLRVRHRPRRPLVSALRTRLTGQPRRDPDEIWLREKQPDFVVISQGSIADGLPWRQFCLTAKIPYAIVVHSNDDSLWFADAEAGAHAQTYLAAKRVFFVSQHNWRLLERQIGVGLPNALIIWSPHNVSRDAAPPWPAGRETARLACVGRLEPAAKGQDILLQVLARPEWRGRPVELNLYGSGPQEQILRALSARLVLPNVHFRGQVENVENIWKENELLVLASRREGLPLTLIEAMSCARPAVVTDVGGSVELCTDGETGFIAAAPVVPCFAEALERAWARRGDWAQMGRAGREHILQVVPRDPVAEFFKILLMIAERPAKVRRQDD